MINHLDWFLSTVWKMVGTVEVEPQMRAIIDNMLTSSSVAVNHLAHMQARLLAGNATFRREGLLDASVLDRAGAQFLRSQPIGGADLFAGKVPEALRVASEDRNKQLLFQAAVKPAGRGAGGSPRGPPQAQRGGFRKRKGFTPSTSQVTHKRPKPQGQTTMSRHVEKGKGAKLGVTATWANEPKILNSTPVGARLRNFPREWDNLTTDRYVRSIVRDGYRVELISAPPLSPVPIPMKLLRDTEQSNALLREIMSLLDKGAIEELDPRSLSPGFYSRLFLVPKTDGSHRPVFDLKSLNQFVHKEKFKMTTPRTVTNAMHKGDWAVSIDLKDAYFHVPIHVRSRRLLRFAIATNDGLRVFEFRALPFGLTSAPRVFTKVILPLGHHAHLHTVCLLQYLDDWLLRSTNKSLLARQTSWLLDIIRRVGFVLNVAKSQLTPTQRLIHIGVEYHLDLGLMFPPMTRVQKFEDKISTLMSVPITTAYIFLSLLGLLSSATDAIPLGRLHLRPLQLYLLSHWAPASKDLKALIPVKHDLLDHHLRWWLDRKCTRAGMLLDIPEAQTHLFTDASESGWGAHLDKHQVSGSWSTREATLHINHLEMLAVLYALRAFLVQLKGLTVQLMSDNASVVSYIRKQGGTVSVPLYLLTREVLILARDAQITLLAKHIPGERNALADLLSRMDKIVHTEWTLLHSVFEALCMAWDTPNLDLFATRLNNRLPVFVSPMADPLAVDVDAMSMS